MDFLQPLVDGYSNFVSPFVTFGAIALWLSIHAAIQLTKPVFRRLPATWWGKALATGRYIAPYALGIIGARMLDVFPGKPFPQVILAGFLCGFVADKFHLIQSRFFGALRARPMTPEQRAQLEKLERIIT